MTTNLFTHPLDTVTVADVEAFLQLFQEEGPTLDYKQADRGGGGVPDSALETIVAFANTYGGLLLLGVTADKATNRPIAWDGLRLNPKVSFEEQVTSRCFGAVVPPLAPEVRVCPFKSDPTLPADDRAFVLVRVAPSLAAPHATKENQVFVRVNSESRLADLGTLRALFAREQQREHHLERLTSSLMDGAAQIRAHFAPELQDERKRERWAPGANRVTVELLPVDGLDELLAFWDERPGVQLLDDRFIDLLAANSWYMQAVEPSDLLRTPTGIGVAAIALNANPTFSPPDTVRAPVDILYLDSSGGLSLDFATSGLGWRQPREEGASVTTFAEQLLKRIVRAMKVLWSLLEEQRYAGRVRVDVWADTGQGFPPYAERTRGHRGTTVFAVPDPFEERGRRLGTMVSRMTRSWLGLTIAVAGWNGDVPILA